MPRSPSFTVLGAYLTLVSGAFSCSCLPPDLIERSCDAGAVALHVRDAREVATCQDGFFGIRIFEVEVMDVLINPDVTLCLVAGERVRIQTEIESAACGVNLQENAEYLLYLQSLTDQGLSGFPVDAEGPENSGGCGESAIMATSLCSGNIQQPSQADLDRARSICPITVSESDVGDCQGNAEAPNLSGGAEAQGPESSETGKASMGEDLTGIIAAVCIVLIGVLRLAAF